MFFVFARPPSRDPSGRASKTSQIVPARQKYPALSEVASVDRTKRVGNIHKPVSLCSRLLERWLKVECVMFEDFEEGTATSSGYIVDCSVFHPLSPPLLPSVPVSYGDLRSKTWIPRRPPSSSLVDLKTRAVAVMAVHDGGQLAARHETPMSAAREPFVCEHSRWSC